SEDEHQKIHPATLQGDIELKNIDFRYGTRQLVLKNVSMRNTSGEKIAIVGESGSGKTTLIRLLMNFYIPEKGDILINGYNLKDINLDVLREKIVFIPQETFFFRGTIRDNLCLGIEGHTDMERIVEA